MARSHATVYTSIWKDPDFVALPPGAQRMYLLILSQPDLNSCGVLAYRPSVWARCSAGSTPARVARDVALLTNAHFLAVDGTTSETCIRSFMRHDGVLKAPNIFKAAARAFGAIHSETIRQIILDGLPPLLRAGFPDAYITMPPKKIGQALRSAQEEGFPKGFSEPFSKGFSEGSPRASSTLHPPPSSPHPSANPSGRPAPNAHRAESEPGTTTAPPTVAGAEAPTEEGSPRTPEHRTAEALDLMAEADLRRATDEGRAIRDRSAYRAKLLTQRTEAHEADLLALATEHPAMDPADLAETLDPTTGHLDGGAARAAAAAAQTEQDTRDAKAERARNRADRERAQAAIAALDDQQRAALEQRAREQIPPGRLRDNPVAIRKTMAAIVLAEEAS